MFSHDESSFRRQEFRTEARQYGWGFGNGPLLSSDHVRAWYVLMDLPPQPATLREVVNRHKTPRIGGIVVSSFGTPVGPLRLLLQPPSVTNRTMNQQTLSTPTMVFNMEPSEADSGS